MTRRKRAEAWVAIDFAGNPFAVEERRDVALNHLGSGETVMKFVEHSPAEDAVVRAAIAWHKSTDFHDIDRVHKALVKAVTRLQKSRRKRLIQKT